jgi:Ca2+-dependent lipid-binding protein
VKRKKKLERKRADSRVNVLPSKSIAERASLSLEIIEGKSLAAKDLGGTSDPFVEIEFEGQVYETSVIWKTLNPQWNEKFNLFVI